MNNIEVSPIEALNAAIQNHNPFSKAGIVKEQDIWGKGFPDIPTLNAHASDAIFQAVEKVQTSQSSQEKVTSLVLTAQQGVGKSHILSRTRRTILMPNPLQQRISQPSTNLRTIKLKQRIPAFDPLR